MENLSNICEEWKGLWDIKEEIAFGNVDIDLEEYKELVRVTYYLIQEMHKHISSGDYSDVSPESMREYMDLVSLISMYSASVTVDESEDCKFTVSRLLAFDLADIACNYSYYDEDEDYDAPDGVIVSIEGYSYGLDRELRYDVNAGDLTDYCELTELIWK